MKDKEFHEKVSEMFKSKLKRQTIRIKNIKENRFLSDEDMDYSKVLFDSDLNIYKITTGKPELVEDSNFMAFLI